MNSINLSDTTALLKIRGESMQKKDIQTKMIMMIGMESDKVEEMIEENELNDGEVCRDS